MLIEVKTKVARKIDGKVRKRTETYILDRDVFAEAEYRVLSSLSQEQELGMVEEFEIVSLKQSAVKELDVESMDDALSSFMFSLRDLYLDDDGNEKQLKYKVLLWADNLTAANQRALELSHQGYEMLIEGIKQVDYIYLL